MRIHILVIMLLLAGTEVSAQPLSAAFDAPGRKRFYFNTGDELQMKLRNEKGGVQPYLITQVSDSGMVLEGRFFVRYQDIMRIRLYPRVRNRGLKKILGYGGIMLPAITGANLLLNRNMPVESATGLFLGSIPFSVAYLGLKLNDWVGVTYCTHRRNRIRPVLIPGGTPFPTR